MIKKRAKLLEQLILAENEREALWTAMDALEHGAPVADSTMYHLFKGRRVEGPAPLLIAHLDTVRRGGPVPGIRCGPGGLWQSSDGGVLGADDRAGVAVACWTHQLTGWPVLLTDGEETGGIGANEVVDTLKVKHAAALCEVERFSCLIQLDRRGCGELVYYDDMGADLAAEIQRRSPGWRIGGGSYTDIATISPEWNVPGVNVAVGYFGEHHDGESLVASYCAALPETLVGMGDVLTSIKRVPRRKVVKRRYSKKYEREYEKWWSGKNGWDFKLGY